MSKCERKKKKRCRHIGNSHIISVELDKREPDLEYGETHPVYSFVFYLDDKVISYPVDESAFFPHLNYSTVDNGKRGSWILTCSCGHAGCAGYHDITSIRFKRDTVQLTACTRDGYDRGVLGTGKGENVVYVNRTAFEAVQNDIIRLLTEHKDDYFLLSGSAFPDKGKEWLSWFK